MGQGRDLIGRQTRNRNAGPSGPQHTVSVRENTWDPGHGHHMPGVRGHPFTQSATAGHWFPLVNSRELHALSVDTCLIHSPRQCPSKQNHTPTMTDKPTALNHSCPTPHEISKAQSSKHISDTPTWAPTGTFIQKLCPHCLLTQMDKWWKNKRLLITHIFFFKKWKMSCPWGALEKVRL